VAEKNMPRISQYKHISRESSIGLVVIVDSV
jgi:hypothetical protein